MIRVMASKAGNLFVKAVGEGDEKKAVHLLEAKLVGPDTIFGSNEEGDEASALRLAVYFERKAVLRTLIELGANVEGFQSVRTSKHFYTPAGDAIRQGKCSMLMLLHGLGASMDRVQLYGPSKTPHCAVNLALQFGEPECLEYLFDHALPRANVLSPTTLIALSGVAEHGRVAIKIFKILESRGFDFSVLREMSLMVQGNRIQGSDGGQDSSGERSDVTLMDCLIVTAQKSGDARLMRYLLKDLKLTAESKRMKTMQGVFENAIERGDVPDHKVSKASLQKYKCATCDSVCETQWCSKCRVARYCSVTCQREHWKYGGHKEHCKTLRASSQF